MSQKYKEMSKNLCGNLTLNNRKELSGILDMKGTRRNSVFCLCFSNGEERKHTDMDARS